MLESNDGLLRLVNCLLDTYRYESAEIEMYKEPVNIRKLVFESICRS